jgi:hypothetical protein
MALDSAWTAIAALAVGAAVSYDPRFFYAVTGDDTGLGISSELLLPGAPPVDAITRITA